MRLNGGGRRLAGIAGLPQGLQMPPVNKEARAAATKALSLEILQPGKAAAGVQQGEPPLVHCEAGILSADGAHDVS